MNTTSAVYDTLVTIYDGTCIECGHHMYVDTDITTDIMHDGYHVLAKCTYCNHKNVVGWINELEYDIFECGQ